MLDTASFDLFWLLGLSVELGPGIENTRDKRLVQLHESFFWHLINESIINEHPKNIFVPTKPFKLQVKQGVLTVGV